jgi:hypothetical protein
MAKGAVESVIHPVRAIQGMEQACSAGYSSQSGGLDGVLQCIDNLDPFAGFVQAFQANCDKQAGEEFGGSLALTAALLAGGADGVAGASGDGIATGNVSVYTSTNAAGDIDYVGITNNLARRAGEHLTSKGISIDPIPGLTNLSRADAKAVEQVLIEQNGGAQGSQLLNKINSISPNNPTYGSSILRCCAILSSVGYPAPGVC